MINTQKIVALAFSYSDGIEDAKKLSSEQKDQLIR
jgi:hypothetical protein